jgi:hypothetical protein
MKSISLHVYGDDESNSENRSKFREGASRLCELAHRRGYGDVDVVEPRKDRIFQAVCSAAKALEGEESASLLLTYTGHGHPGLAPGCLNPGAGWKINDGLFLHKEVLKKLIVGRFASSVEVVVVSDSCYGAQVGDERFWRLLLMLFEAKGDVDRERLMKAYGYGALFRSLNDTIDISNAACAASAPQAKALYVSAGDGQVPPAEMSNVLWRILSREGTPTKTWEQLRTELSEVPGYALDPDVSGWEHKVAFKP